MIDEVLRLRREGVRESVVHTLRDEYQEDDIDAEELRKILDLQLTPGAAVAVPAWGQATEALIRRGQEIYVKQNCPRCHGRDGNGDTGLYLADEEGYPTRPRNLVWEEFKSRSRPAVGLRAHPAGLARHADGRQPEPQRAGVGRPGPLLPLAGPRTEVAVDESSAGEAGAGSRFSLAGASAVNLAAGVLRSVRGAGKPIPSL